MIPITKKAEPDGLAELRRKAAEQGLSPEAAYKTLHNPLKKRVRDSLVEEQGGLCAYCMCKIPRSDAGDQTPINIEHYISRNPVDGMDVGQGLDYRNFFAVCHGNRGKHGTRRECDLTCDAHRGNTKLRKVNPLAPSTLASICYDMKGNIDATDPDVRFDLVQTLDLNCPSAPQPAERKAVLDTLLNDLNNIPQEMLESYCTQVLSNYLSESNPKTPYVGVLIWYLQSLLAALHGT